MSVASFTPSRIATITFLVTTTSAGAPLRPPLSDRLAAHTTDSPRPRGRFAIGVERRLRSDMVTFLQTARRALWQTRARAPMAYEEEVRATLVKVSKRKIA